MANIKFDKETLIKHRFWIALGVFAPLWLVAWLVLWLSVSGAVEVKKTEYAKSIKDIEGVKDPKNPNYTRPMNEKKDTLAGRKNEVWKDVYSTQWNYATDWPKEPPEIAALSGAPFMSPIKGEDVVARQKYRDVVYKGWRDRKREEFYGLGGPMSMDFDQVIGMAPISENREHPVSADEIWLNAESVWTKRELLYVLRKTIEDIAYFQAVKPEKEEPLP